VSLGLPVRVRSSAAEVDQHDAVFCGQENVVGFDVAVQQPRSVDDLECRAELPGDAEGFRDGERALVDDVFGQRRALEGFHDDVRGVVLLEGVVNLHDVRMVEALHDLGFLEEFAFGFLEVQMFRRRDEQALAGAAVGKEFFDGNARVASCVGCQVRDAEPALPEGGFDAVTRLDPRARLEVRGAQAGTAIGAVRWGVPERGGTKRAGFHQSGLYAQGRGEVPCVVEPQNPRVGCGRRTERI
jgi:hypothetical protein